MGARVAKVALVLSTALVGTPSWAWYDTYSKVEYKLSEETLTAEVSRRPQGAYTGSIRVPESVNCDGQPYRVNGVGSQAFKDSPGLTELVLPATIEYISSYAFENCTALTVLRLSNKATSIGAGAFRGDAALTTVVLPTGLTELGEGCFDGCSKLNGLTIPSKVVALGKNTFRACESLSYMELPKGVLLIPDDCFHGCKGLTNIKCLGKVTSIGVNAFSGCVLLQSAPLPTSLTTIGAWAFCTCEKLATPKFPSKVSYIGSFAFYGCDVIKEVNLSKVRNVGASAFQNCKSLARIVGANDPSSLLGPTPWPREVATRGLAYEEATEELVADGEEGDMVIDELAFADCPLLESVVLPDNVVRLGAKSFKGCPSLRSVTLPVAATEGVDATAFADCPALESVVVYGAELPGEVPAALAAALPEGVEPQAAILNSANADGNGKEEGTDDGRLALKLAMQAAAAECDDAYTLSGVKTAPGHKGIVVKGGKLQVRK